MKIAKRIGAEIEARIASGEWQPGHRIPFEHELVAHYGCARATVGKALTALVRAGLLERRRKAGTFVAYPHVQSAVLDIPDIGKAIAERTGSYRFDLLTSDFCKEEGHSENFASGTSLRHLTGIHHGQDGPFAFVLFGVKHLFFFLTSQAFERVVKIFLEQRPLSINARISDLPFSVRQRIFSASYAFLYSTSS